MVTDPAPGDPLAAIVHMAQNLADDYRARGRTWNECKKALSDLRRVVATYDQRWKEENQTKYLMRFVIKGGDCFSMHVNWRLETRKVDCVHNK